MALPEPDSFELNDWRNEDHDPENLDSPPRAFSWYRSWTSYSNRSGPGYGAASIRSIASHWSIAWIAKWSSGSKRTSAPIEPPKLRLPEAQNRFIEAILGEEPHLDIQPTCIWYISFLESKIKEGWTLFSCVLKGVDPHEEEPCNEAVSIAFQVLETIVLDLERQDLTLAEMVDTLYNNDMLRNTDIERSHANQLVLAAFGWISTLYSARLNPDVGKLQIINPQEGPSRRRKSKTFTNYEQSFDNHDQPFNSLLGTFGKIIPKRSKQPGTGQMTPSTIPTKPDEEWIELNLLCFSTLSKVTCIKIEWVDNLSLHLEFDSCTKVLNVFRFPSLCLLMCCCKKMKMSPLSRLFSDSIESNTFFSVEVELEDAKDFYKEVLLTYRLLFGQDTSSYKHFNALKRKGALISEENRDLLLSTLCGESWESKDARQVYEMIDVEEPSLHYSPSNDFPFLGRRLLDIQKYVRGHNSNTIRAIWFDRRNPLGWWTFWAVIIIGSLGLILALAFGISQTVLSILQVIYTKEQLQQNTSPAPVPAQVTM